jgi:hypothetical protein
MAARLAGFGTESGIFLSAHAWTQVSDRVRASPLGLVPIKGKGDLEVYKVIVPE